MHSVPALAGRAGRTGAALVAGLALVVYVRTLLPAQAFGDWGEMQTVPHILGVAHPTGYPTYVLLAWLAELLPIGSVAFRANLLSAVFIAATLATVVLICIRLGVRPTLAVAASLAIGAVGTIWAAATVAEVNPLHVLFAALILHRALVWEARRAPSDLAIGGLLVGLSLGNHLLTLFIAPLVALFVLWAGRHELRARPALLALPIAGLLAGLAVYLYIPIAASFKPALPYNDPVTVDRFLFLVTGEQFRGQFDFLSPAGPAEFLRSLPELWSVALSRGTAVVPLLGIAGLVVLLVRRAALGLACLAMLVIGFYLWATYLRLEHYLLVPWLLLGIGLAVSLETAARGLERLVTRATRGRSPGDVTRRIGGAAAPMAGLAFAVTLTAVNWSQGDRSQDRSAAEYADLTFAALPPNAAIFTSWDAAGPLWYARYVEGRRPDVLIVDDTNVVYEGWGTREARIASLICTHPIFTIRINDADLVPTARLYRVEPFLSVPAALNGPTAEVKRWIYRVTLLDPGAC
jgi:transmembrane protein TMEM260 (protein O-mannosyltransferase)